MRYGYTDSEGDHTDVFPGNLKPGGALGGWAAFTSTGRPTRFWIIEVQYRGDYERREAARQGDADRREQGATRTQQLSAQFERDRRIRREELAEAERLATSHIENARARGVLVQEGVNALQTLLDQYVERQRNAAIREWVTQEAAESRSRMRSSRQEMDEPLRLARSAADSLRPLRGRISDIEREIERQELLYESEKDPAPDYIMRDEFLASAPMRLGIMAALAQEVVAITRSVNSIRDSVEARSLEFAASDQIGGQVRQQTLAVPEPVRESRSISDIPSLGARFKTLKFSENGAEGTPPIANRRYTNIFDSERTRYISVELTFDFDAPLSSTMAVEIDCIFTNGATSWRQGRTVSVPLGWRGLVTAEAFGWPDAGKWPVGTWTVGCSSEGHTFGSETFIVRAPAVIASLGARLSSMRFFERGSSSVALPDRNYAVAFDASTARYIATEITFDFDAPVSTLMTAEIQCTYRKDGTTSTINVPVAPQVGWRGIVLVKSVGWVQPGGWSAGKWTVSCSYQGTEFATQSFVVHAPADIEPLGGRYTSMKFFEQPVTGTPPLADRKYAEVFESSTTRFIITELTFAFDSPVPAAASIEISCTYSSGVTLYTQTRSLTIPAGWRAVVTTKALGWDKPGNWPAGTWNVACSIDGRVFGVQTFVIRPPETLLGGRQ